MTDFRYKVVDTAVQKGVPAAKRSDPGLKRQDRVLKWRDRGLKGDRGLQMLYPHVGESADALKPSMRGPQSRRGPKWVPQRTADPFDGTDDDDDEDLSDSDDTLLQKLGDFSCELPALLLGHQAGISK